MVSGGYAYCWLYRPSVLRKSGILLSVDTPAPPKIRYSHSQKATASKFRVLSSLALLSPAEHPKWIPPAPERPLNHLVQKNSVERLDILAVRNVFHLLRQGIPEQPLGQLCDGEHLQFSLGNEPGFLDDLRAALI